MNYIVIAKIGNKDYLVNVEEDSYMKAEHRILDMGVCGKHEYGVDGAQAYSYGDMKFDHFVNSAIKAETVSLKEITEIIKERNAKIRAKDEAENRIREIEKQMKKLTEELEVAKKFLAE